MICQGRQDNARPRNTTKVVGEEEENDEPKNTCKDDREGIANEAEPWDVYNDSGDTKEYVVKRNSWVELQEFFNVEILF